MNRTGRGLPAAGSPSSILFSIGHDSCLTGRAFAAFNPHLGLPRPPHKDPTGQVNFRLILDLTAAARAQLVHPVAWRPEC